MRRSAWFVTFLLGLSGCGSSIELDSDAATGASPSPTNETVESVELVDPGPGELIVGRQTEDVDENGDVAAYLLARTDVKDNAGDTRTVCLHMSIVNRDGPGLAVVANYVVSVGSTVPVKRVSCSSQQSAQPPLPEVIPPGGSMVGTLGYVIPDSAGRLYLKGTHNFDWFVGFGTA